jgi:DNA polymerase II
MKEIDGWILDLYADPQGGVCIWCIQQDGQRCCFRQSFPITFYASGSPQQLQTLKSYLQNRHPAVSSCCAERRDVFQPKPVQCLAMQVPQPARVRPLFFELDKIFPDLTWYDVDVPLWIRHGAVWGTFPLGYCRLTTNEENCIQHIETLDSAWDTDPELPTLRVMSIGPNCNPLHASPSAVIVHHGDQQRTFPLFPERPLLVNIAALLRRLNPDILLSRWGDTWLLPKFLELSGARGIPLPLNRDARLAPARRKERSYFSYGQIVHRGQQVKLFGRLHLDRSNAMLWHDYQLDGVLETARVTCQPIQDAARLSPGTGISAMQMAAALRTGVLVPWHKQQSEHERSALDLLQRDRGGIVYQPTIGLHTDVAEIDFISMYPGIMVCHNISPETAAQQSRLDGQQTPGLIPETLSPLLVKRVILKQRLSKTPAWHPRCKRDKAHITAHKWLLVTCFGYLGYKNARFGQIGSHEAVTEAGREALLTAKEEAEEMGFSLLHMYVDGLWVHRDGLHNPQDYQSLLERITEHTGLPISLEGVYRWVCFLPSRADERVPVGNRYFGVFQDGSIKMRGIEARRRDTPPFIANTQVAILECLAEAPDAEQLQERLNAALNILRRQLQMLREDKIELSKLLTAQKLSRDLEAYTNPSPAARAARQLKAVGKTIRPGQRIQFLYMRGQPDVYAWDLPNPPDPNRINRKYYQELLLRSAETVLKPFGLNMEKLHSLSESIPAVQPMLTGMQRYTFS